MTIFFLAPSRSLECWRAMGGRTELKRGGWVGRKQCYCTAQTPGLQKKRTQQDFSSNEMCVKKLIQARVIWHTQTKVPATRQTSELTGDWSPESFVQLSPIFLTPWVHIWLCWWVHHFLRGCGWVQLEQMPLWPPPKARDVSIFWNHLVRGSNQSFFPKLPITPFNLWRAF